MTTSSPPAPRELSFELHPTFGEHLRAQKAAQWHGRGRQIRLQQLLGAAIGIPFGLWILHRRDGRLDWTDWLLVAIVAGYFVSPLPAVLHVRRIRRAAAGPARVTIAERGFTTTAVIIPGLSLLLLAFGRALPRGRVMPVRMRVDDAGVTFSGGGSEATTAWPGIRRVQQAGGFLLFWIDRNTAHYLPLRALGGDAEEARRIIRRHTGEHAAR
ncbi:MAG TPA: YcxB family protein [Longimicrobium sp.]|nr:YcxB family protein [Longimicrobium sp.]